MCIRCKPLQYILLSMFGDKSLVVEFILNSERKSISRAYIISITDTLPDQPSYSSSMSAFSACEKYKRILPIGKKKEGISLKAHPFCCRRQRLSAEIHYMNISSQADVIGQIPADVIRVRIDDDIVGIPQPVAAIG